MLNFFRKKPSEFERLTTKWNARAPGAEETELKKCANCGEQLNTVNLTEWVKVYCDRCKLLLRNEELTNANLPRYDISEILSNESAYTIVSLIADKTYVDAENRSIPWDKLLPPEAVCKAFRSFSAHMGNGFASLLELGGGPDIFIRGHRAIQTVGATECLEVTTAAKEIMERHGMTFPDPVTQDWWPPDEGIDFDLGEKIGPEMRVLDSLFGKAEGKLPELIVCYIREHIDTFRIRMPK